jgi:VWFA-related protein
MNPECFLIGIRRVIPVLSLSLLAMAGYSQGVATPSAQTAQSKAGSAYLKAYTEEVVVDVVVTDRKGDTVRNISRDHFRVLEDGKPQEFRFFRERGAADADAVQPAQASRPLPQHVYSNRTAAGTEEQSAPLVLLLDGLNTSVKDQMYIRKQALAFLKLIPPGTRVALFDLNLGMKVLAGFTTDTSVIAAAVADT